MNSSGIKRGLAATAISALAVTGLPALASMASSAPGDSFTVTYTGPALNGGTEGAVVVIRAENGDIDPNLLDVVGTGSAADNSEDTADQNVEVVSATSQGANSGGTGFELIEVRIAVTTSTTGDTATFRLFEDDAPTDGDLDAGEARQQVAISTAGPLATIDVEPENQSTPQGIESGDYTVTLKDSAGRTTQLAPGTTITVNDENPVEATDVAADDVIDSDEIARGTATFEANPNGAAPDVYDITLNQGAISDTVTLTVTQAADLTADEIDIVTAADTWDGFGDGTNGGTTLVRVDQNTIRFDFDSDDVADRNSNVQLTVDGTGVTFAGQDKATYTTTLDGQGNGSITVTVDAATIQEGDFFDADINGFDQRLEFDRAESANIDGAQSTYFCQDDGACTVTAVVTDQFGNPVTTGEVEASRQGPQNTDATPQRKPVGSDGTVEFTFTDANPADGGSDQVLFEYFVDQFDQTADESDNSTTIKYSATGQGSDYVISLDGNNTEAPGYKASDSAVIPLTDTLADTTTGPDDEDAVITLTGGEANQAVTLSVDNGALILAPGEDELSEGSASVETTLNGAGDLPAGYRVIGTKSGPVTLTVDSASRTETAELTVKAQDDPETARNVTLTGPASVPFGTTQVTFTATITDAFGNPVAGAYDAFNKRVTGPGEFQDGETQADANGQMEFTVKVDNGASGDITLTLDAFDGLAQYGAEEDRQFSFSTTDDGEGLPASSDVASATTTVEEEEVVAPCEPVNPSLVVRGRNNGAKNDNVVARAINLTEGATVRLFRKTAMGLKQLRVETMNSKGNHKFLGVKDRNGRKYTKYIVRVEATDCTNPGKGGKKLR